MTYTTYNTNVGRVQHVLPTSRRSIDIYGPTSCMLKMMELNAAATL